MLHRSFKPAKCKTALNLAKSRIKLMKNKKDIQVKQLRRELAHLLDSGQDQTARIRVEHVVREEKLMDAYELIALYCELIVARLPIIESQKNCPLDLKEAITSLIFAAPRCGDIPELQDVRKHFTAKYGKEFVAAAIELRPQCGVSRSMVEKLSVKAPDGPTKVKILTAIAEEHNIKWEPKWFKDEDPMPSADMQKVEHVEQPGKIQMEPLNFDIGDSIQQPHAHDAARSASSSQSNAHVNEVLTSVTSHRNARAGSSSEQVVFSQSSGMGENAFPVSNQKWNMEFEDAAAAAHAAAESAERASMAARAAAELSTRSKMTSDDSSGPSNSSAHGWSEGGKAHIGSVLRQKNAERNSANSSFNQKSPRVQNANERHHMTEGAEDKTLKEGYTESGVQYGNREESGISSYPVHQDMGRQSRDSFSAWRTSEAESKVFDSSNHQEYGNEPSENPFYQEPVEMERPPSSFQSDSGSLGDKYGVFSNLNHQNVQYDSDDGSFDSFNQGTGNNDVWHPKTTYPSGFYEVKEDASLNEQGGRTRVVGSGYGFDSGRDTFVKADHRSDEMDVNKIGTQTDSAVVFDDSGSDDDECILDAPLKSHDFPSPGRSSANQFAFPQKNSPRNLASQSSFSSHSHHGLDISESFRESPIYSKLIEPLPVSYDSDGASSGTETELHHEKTGPVIRSNDYREPENNSVSNNEPQKSQDPGSQFQYESPPSPEGGMTLNFGMLPTGRRNRSNWSPPYVRGALSADSSSETYSKAAVDDAVGASQETSSALHYQVSSKEMEKTVPRETSELHARINSTNNDEVVFTPKGPDTRQMPYTAITHEFAHTTRSKDLTGSFDSEDSSSEEDAPKRPVIRKTPLGAGLSRRTKVSTPRLVARTHPSIMTDNVGEAERPSSSDTQVSPKLQAGYTGFGSTSRPRPQTKAWKENESLSSSAVEEVTSPARRTEIPRASNSIEKAPSRENSTKTPSHVHPKLPDFETLTTQLQSLRANRR